MARLARLVIPGIAHHVTQRGNGRARTFFSDGDYAAYRDDLARSCAAAGAAVWSWVLMPNHVHLILVPEDEDGLRRALAPVHRRHAGRVHRRLGRTGHFWQGRFGCVAIDEAHLAAFSRKVIGWALDDHLEARLAIEALDMALETRDPAPETLIHHSDRGVQYASIDYARRLSARGIATSMSRVANPYDNAKAESFMKTLKTEEVNGKAYATIGHARRDIGRFIDAVYNTQRLHSALGYKPPAEFEAELSHSSNHANHGNIALSPN